jgi:hypothetical protein
VNPVFATSAFWQLYLTLEASGVSDDDFAAQLEDLRMDYAVRDES